MLKNFLIQCAELLNRNDIIYELKIHSSVNEIKEQSIQNDILRLISFYNYINSSVFDKYLELIKTEIITTNSEGKIYFSMLSKTPIKIIKIDNTYSLKFMTYPNYIVTNHTNKELKITYQYLPKEATNLSDNLFTDDKNIINTITYGVISEFLASKSLFNESEFWKNRFLYNLFNLKTNKNRFIKASFVL